MGYFDNLFYIGEGGQKSLPVLLWHLTSDSHKTWHNYTMRYEFFKFSKIFHDVIPDYHFVATAKNVCNP